MSKAALSAIIGLVVIAILAAALLPTAMDNIYGAGYDDLANGTRAANFTGGSINLWDTLPIFIVLAMLLIVVAIALKQMD